MPAMKPSLKSVTDVVVSVVLVTAALTVIYRNVVANRSTTATQLTVPSDPVSLDGAIVRGQEDAKTVMVVFADFQCPYCGSFGREVLPEIERRYVANGRVALAFRHLPLPIHAKAVHAAVVAECAARQGKFWEMHDRLFSEQILDDDVLQAAPQAVGLDQQLFNECLQDSSLGDKIQASVNQARQLGIKSTPAFLFGERRADGRVKVGRALSGSRPLEDFVNELDATLGDDNSFWRRWPVVSPRESANELWLDCIRRKV